MVPKSSRTRYPSTSKPGTMEGLRITDTHAGLPPARVSPFLLSKSHSVKEDKLPDDLVCGAKNGQALLLRGLLSHAAGLDVFGLPRQLAPCFGQFFVDLAKAGH